jgi:hypothetical protein
MARRAAKVTNPGALDPIPDIPHGFLLERAVLVHGIARAPSPVVTSSSLTEEWQRLKRASPGKRFQAFNERQQQRARGPIKALYLGGALVSLAVGVVLVFIPGPAFVFFILAGGLLAAQSRWMAERLDRLEVTGREKATQVRAWWRRARRSSPGTSQGHKRG